MAQDNGGPREPPTVAAEHVEHLTDWLFDNVENLPRPTARAISTALIDRPDVALRALGGEQHGGRADTHAEYVHFAIGPKVAVWVFDTREAI